MNKRVFEGVTIDPAGASDLDDAIWLTKHDGGYLLEVAIPWAGRLVPIGGDLDQSAFDNAFTRYRGAYSKSLMMPDAISDELSLMPGADRNILLITMMVDSNFEIELKGIEKAIFKSRAKLSYANANTTLSGYAKGPYTLFLQDLYALATGLANARRSAGALFFYDLKKGVYTNEEGAIMQMFASGYRAEMIVREAMIATNTVLAQYCAEHHYPLLFRNHRASPVADRKTLLDDMLLMAGEDPSVEAVKKRFAMVMGRARLAPTVQGHFALNLSAYAWFTSPIRRYCDLVNQRILGAAVDGEVSPYTIAELDQIGASLNSAYDRDREDTVQRHKAAAERQAEVIVKNGHVGTASDIAFKRIVKHATTKGEISDQVKDEALKRLHAGQLTPKEIARMLLAGGKLGQEVGVYLTAVPATAVSIVSYGVSALGWSGYQYEETTSGPIHAPNFEVQATLTVDGNILVSPVASGGSRKEAQQRATVILLGMIVGLDFPQPTIAERVVLPTEPKISSEKKPPDNSRGQLLEICQRRKWAPPSFQVEQNGPSHAPSFSAIGRLKTEMDLIETHQVRGTSKKEVERLASAELIAAIDCR